MKLSRFLFVLISITLASCTTVREEIPGPVKKIQVEKIKVADFVLLIDSLKKTPIQADAKQRLSTLQLKNNYAEMAPLSDIVLLFETLMQSYPLTKHDALLYELSRLYEKNRYHKYALTLLNTLITEYPQTLYLDAAQFRKAEVLYSQQQFSKAQAAYQQVIAYRKEAENSLYYEQAVYKLGWSQFKLSQYNAALNSFLFLLDLHARNDELPLQQMGVQERKFIENIMQGITLSFVHQAGPVSAVNYFHKKQKRPYEYQLFSSLASYYQKKNKITDAVNTYRAFVSLNEVNKKSPGFLVRVIELYEQGGFVDELLDARKDFVLRYSVNQNYWGLYSKKQTRNEHQALKNNLSQLLKYYKEKSKQTSNKSDFIEAQRWARIWLGAFKNDEGASEVRLQLAELLNENKQYAMAALQYESVAYDYKQSAISSSAGYDALLMYANHEKRLMGFAKNQWHQLFLASVRRFSQRFPAHPEAIVFNRRGGDKLTSAAAGLSKKSEFELATQFLGQRNWSLATALLEKFGNAMVQPQLREDVAKKLAITYQLNGDTAKASQALEELSYLSAQIPQQISALWLAAEFAEQVNNPARAKKLYETYIKRFPYPLNRAIEARQRIVDIVERTGNALLATQWRVQLVNADARGGDYRTSRTRYLAAKASLLLAQPLLERYRKAKLTLPLDDSLKVKMGFLDEAVSAYNNAASYRVPAVLTASTFRVAEMYRDLARSVMQLEKTSNLSGKEQLQYKKQLQKRALPYKEKAFVIHQLNVSRIAKGINDAWVKKSQLQLQ